MTYYTPFDQRVNITNGSDKHQVSEANPLTVDQSFA